MASSARRRAPTLSLKGRALQLLAQRDHSRTELRRKLLRHAVAACGPKDGRAGRGASADDIDADSGMPLAVDPDPDLDADADAEVGVDAEVDASVQAGPCLDKLLDWLEEHRYLSDERFVESRVHVREARFGNRRIAAELAQHGVTLPPETADALKTTEADRAYGVWSRKFDGPPADASDWARQSRFLMARGFSTDAVRSALRRGKSEAADGTTAFEASDDGE